MYLLSLFYLYWINFWRLPESDQAQRAETKHHKAKVEKLKIVWIISLLLLVLSGHVALMIMGISFLTFLSFLFLDEV